MKKKPKCKKCFNTGWQYIEKTGKRLPCPKGCLQKGIKMKPVWGKDGKPNSTKRG
jgi:hypothetical protein